jgi:hypothetical protein
MRLSCHVASAAALLAALAGAARADVIRVPQDYKNIQVAVNNAADGDVILVAPGKYAGPVDIGGKSLSIVADGGTASVPRLRVHDLAAGQTVLLRGMTGDGTWYSFPMGPNEEGLVVENCEGLVVAEDCTFIGMVGVAYAYTYGWHGARVEHSSAVAFVRCTLTGGNGEFGALGYSAGAGGHGLFAVGTDASLHECTVTGGHASYQFDLSDEPGAFGGSGAHLVGGQLLTAGNLFTGGDGGNASCTLSLSECGIGGDGGDGILLPPGSAAEVFVHGDSFDPGPGGQGGSGQVPPGEDGQAIDSDPATVHRLHSAIHTLELTAPTREGESVTVSLHGEPGDMAFLWSSPDPAWLLLPTHEGVLLVDRFAPGFLVTALGTLDGSGELSLSVPVPELGQGVQDVVLTVQGVFVADGVTLLGSASTAVLLDSGF